LQLQQLEFEAASQSWRVPSAPSSTWWRPSGAWWCDRRRGKGRRAESPPPPPPPAPPPAPPPPPLRAAKRGKKQIAAKMMKFHWLENRATGSEPGCRILLRVAWVGEWVIVFGGSSCYGEELSATSLLVSLLRSFPGPVLFSLPPYAFVIHFPLRRP
jgi:hypothetical protein